MPNSFRCKIKHLHHNGTLTERECDRILKALEQEQKTGHWIDIMVGDMPAQVCDQCKTFYPLSYTGGGHNYCPSCGSRMVEPQESEDEE